VLAPAVLAERLRPLPEAHVAAHRHTMGMLAARIMVEQTEQGGTAGTLGTFPLLRFGHGHEHAEEGRAQPLTLPGELQAERTGAEVAPVEAGCQLVGGYRRLLVTGTALPVACGEQLLEASRIHPYPAHLVQAVGAVCVYHRRDPAEPHDQLVHQAMQRRAGQIDRLRGP